MKLENAYPRIRTHAGQVKVRSSEKSIGNQKIHALGFEPKRCRSMSVAIKIQKNSTSQIRTQLRMDQITTQIKSQNTQARIEHMYLRFKARLKQNAAFERHKP